MIDQEAAAGLVERARHMLNEYPLCNFERLVVADLLSELERVGKERDALRGAAETLSGCWAGDHFKMLTPEEKRDVLRAFRLLRSILAGAS